MEATGAASKGDDGTTSTRLTTKSVVSQAGSSRGPTHTLSTI
jgi:hypothetical protein